MRGSHVVTTSPNSCDCLLGVVYYLCLDTFDILRPLHQYKHGNNLSVAISRAAAKGSISVRVVYR